MLNKTADLRNKLVLLALWVNQKRKHTNSRSSSSSSSSSDPPGWDSCDGCWWWMIVGQRACFLDVPLTSMSHTQISSEDERYTHTFTYMTRIHTEPTTHTHTHYTLHSVWMEKPYIPYTDLHLLYIKDTRQNIWRSNVNLLELIFSFFLSAWHLCAHIYNIWRHVTEQWAYKISQVPVKGRQAGKPFHPTLIRLNVLPKTINLLPKNSLITCESQHIKFQKRLNLSYTVVCWWPTAKQHAVRVCFVALEERHFVQFWRCALNCTGSEELILQNSNLI